VFASDDCAAPAVRRRVGGLPSRSRIPKEYPPPIAAGKETRAELAWRRIREIGAVLSSVVVAVGVGVWAYGEFEHLTRDQTAAAERRLDLVPSWFLIDKFRSELGSPAVRVAVKHRTVAFFQGPNSAYWVEVVYDAPTGAVHGWVVTSCYHGYAPQFFVPGTTATARLWHTTFEQLKSLTVPGEVSDSFGVPGSSGASDMSAFDVRGGSDAADYRAAIWGLSGHCGDGNRAFSSAILASAGGNPNWYFTGSAAKETPRLRRVLSRTPINYFGVVDDTLPMTILQSISPVVGFPPDFRAVLLPVIH
jgi:hypothetical protein